MKFNTRYKLCAKFRAYEIFRKEYENNLPTLADLKNMRLNDYNNIKTIKMI